MSLLIAARTAQDVLESEFTFNFNDTMVPVGGGAAVDFGETNTSATTVMIIPLPPGATVVGGSVDTVEAFDGGLTADIGDATDPNRYLAAGAVGGVGRVPLVPTGYLGEVGENVDMVFTAGASTTGRATVRVQYTVAERACEVQIA